MTSNINPNNINGNYPVAGQDNDSQGFRDNFTNVKTNLAFAKLELEDLQNKALLKSALTGSTLTNDLANAVLYRAQLKAYATTFNDLGTQTGILNVSFLDGGVQKATTTGAVTLGLSDFPAAGTFGSLKLWLEVTSIAHTLLLPQSVTLGLSNIAGLGNKTITFTDIGNYMFEFSTADGGLNYWITKAA